MASDRELIFYFDVLSAFSYVAFHVTRNTPSLSNSSIQISYRPVFLGAILSATGNRPPMTIRNKSTYSAHDFARQAARFSVPLSSATTTSPPTPTLLAQRALCLVEAQFSDIYVPAIEALYHALWVEHVRLGDTGDLEDVLARLLPRAEAERVVDEAAEGDWARLRLKAYTEEALERGCFGLPYFVTRRRVVVPPGKVGKGRDGREGAKYRWEEERWWGFDHLKQAAEWLGVDVAAIEGAGEPWRSML